MQAQTHLNAKIAKLTVKVPEPLSEEIDERGTESHTSFGVRKVLAGMTEPTLASSVKEGIAQGYADIAVGRTMAPTEAENRFGIEDDSDE